MHQWTFFQFGASERKEVLKARARLKARGEKVEEDYEDEIPFLQFSCVSSIPESSSNPIVEYVALRILEVK
jgi:hypothetical protein